MIVAASSASLAVVAPLVVASISVLLGVFVAFIQQRRTSDIRTELSRPDSGGQVDRDSYAVLKEYSAQGLAQSQISFWASIIFAALGFLVILGGVGVVIFQHATLSQALIPVISGAIVEAVSALFFTVSARTQRVMVEFFDKLREDRRLEEALKLVPGIADPTTASRLQVLLALQFVGLSDLPGLYQQAVGDHPAARAPDPSQANQAPN